MGAKSSARHSAGSTRHRRRSAARLAREACRTGDGDGSGSAGRRGGRIGRKWLVCMRGVRRKAGVRGKRGARAAVSHGVRTCRTAKAAGGPSRAVFDCTVCSGATVSATNAGLPRQGQGPPRRLGVRAGWRAGRLRGREGRGAGAGRERVQIRPYLVRSGRRRAVARRAPRRGGELARRAVTFPRQCARMFARALVRTAAREYSGRMAARGTPVRRETGTTP